MAGYMLVRDETQGIVLALAQRVLDVGLVFALPALWLPCADRVLARLGEPFPSAAGRSITLVALSLAALALAITFLGAIGFLSAGAIASVSLLPAFLGARAWPRVGHTLGAGLRSVGPELRSFPGFLTLLVLGLGLLMTLTPSVSQDALHYHLAVPQVWLQAGFFDEVPGNVYSRFPMNAEMWFLGGLALRGEMAAKCFHWLLAVLCCVQVGRTARRLAPGNLGAWSALVFITVPTVFRVSTWAYVELAGVLFLLLAWELLDRQRRVTVGEFILFGFCLGFACGTKYTLLAPAAVLFIWGLLRLSQVSWKSVLGCVAAGLFAGGYWYFRNLFELGNPLYPFLYSWFGGPGWDSTRAQLFMASLQEWGQVGWNLPFALTFDATFASVSRFDGIVGPAFLLAVPFLIVAAVRFRRVRPTFAFTVMLLVLWVTTTRQIRFLVPALAFGAALFPAGWQALAGTSARGIARSLVAAAAVVSLSTHLILFAQLNPLPFVCGLESVDRFRERSLPGGDYAVFRSLEHWVGKDGKVLLGACGNPLFLCTSEVHADSVIENHTLRQLFQDSPSPRATLKRFRDRGFTHLLFRFPLVFGDQSDLTYEEQRRLQAFLNRYMNLAFQRDQTLLYELKEGV